MKVNLPGLVKERLPSGNHRWRVRVEGDTGRKIRLHVAPEHKEFMEHYHAARAGICLPAPEGSGKSTTPRGTLAWLIEKYLDYMAQEVAADLVSEKTLKKRRNLLNRLSRQYGHYAMIIPRNHLLTIRDDMAKSPANADAMIAAIRCMYKWAEDRNICDQNTAIGIPTIHRSKGGAIPWSVEDLNQYRERHRPGTTAHLYLTILMFTACRVSDAAVLGRANEFERDGMRWLGWQPRKKNSPYVAIPMLPPLYNATRAVKVQGPTYLLTSRGKPFRSADALGQRMQKWCHEAGLEKRVSHGVRKAVGHLLAQHDCTQYHLMCVHGHRESRTSEIYTKGVERSKLAAEAMKKLERMEW